MSLTRQDLEAHEARISSANERVVNVLKDVAIQFNTIANQLLTLSRTTEAIIDAQQIHSVQLHDAFKERIADQTDRLVDKMKTVLTSLNTAIDSARVQAADAESTVSSLRDDLKDYTSTINKSIVSLEAKVISNLDTIQKNQEEAEKKRIEGRTKFLIIFGIISGILTVAGGLIALLKSAN